MYLPTIVACSAALFQNLPTLPPQSASMRHFPERYGYLIDFGQHHAAMLRAEEVVVDKVDFEVIDLDWNAHLESDALTRSQRGPINSSAADDQRHAMSGSNSEVHNVSGDLAPARAFPEITNIQNRALLQPGELTRGAVAGMGHYRSDPSKNAREKRAENATPHDRTEASKEFGQTGNQVIHLIVMLLGGALLGSGLGRVQFAEDGADFVIGAGAAVAGTALIVLGLAVLM